jgi:hypothetical protein
MNSQITLDTRTLLKEATIKIHIQFPKSHRIRIFFAPYFFKIACWVAGTKSLIEITVPCEGDDEPQT